MREVWVVRGRELQPCPVTTGAASGELTEILGGLVDGDTVAVGLTAASREPQTAAERSPFMPTPPGGNDKKK